MKGSRCLTAVGFTVPSGIITLLGMWLDRVVPDSPIAGWLYLAATAALAVSAIVYKVVSRASENVRVGLVLFAVMGPLPPLLAASTYFPSLGLTTLKIGIGYAIAFVVAAGIVGIVYWTRRFGED